MKEKLYGYETTEASTYELLLRNAKSHRRYSTEAEALLWCYLRANKLGVHFRRQHPVNDYIPDFVCLKEKLVVEVDGGYHFVGNQPINDEIRTKHLNAAGFHVLRFTNEEVLFEPERIVSQIRKVIEYNRLHNLSDKQNICLDK